MKKFSSRMMMGKLKINSTFYLQGLECFAIAGDLVSGTIEKGMFFFLKDNNQKLIKLQIFTTMYGDSPTSGKIMPQIVVCMKCDKMFYDNYWKKLSLIGKTFTARKLKHRGLQHPRELIVKTYRPGYRSLSAISSIKSGFLTGGIYTLSATDDTTTNVCYRGMTGTKHLAFSFLEKPQEMRQGSKIKIEELKLM